MNLHDAIDACEGVPIGYHIIKTRLVPLMDYLKEELGIDDGKEEL